MAVLRAVVPAVPESRTAIVAARVARKLAPLFGVFWQDSPFPFTWVSDYHAITVSEIARGAPSPTRAEAHAVDESAGVRGWTTAGRAVAAALPDDGPAARLPNEIANATVNRFGPDTKASLILSGSNALLAPITASVIEALSFLDVMTPVGQLPVASRVAAWASLVFDAYCAQPALFAAALQARAVQRANESTWVLTHPGPFARSEIRGEGESSTGSCDFDLLDQTLAAGLRADRDLLGTDAVRYGIVNALADRLHAVGGPASTNYVWLSERKKGHRAAHAFCPADPVLTTYASDVDDRLDATTLYRGARLADTSLPSIPMAGEVAHLTHRTRQCVAMALCALLRTAFGSGNPDPFADLHVLATLDALDSFCDESLPAHDPAGLIIRARLADMRVEVLRQDVAHDAVLPDAVSSLIGALGDALRRARRGEDVDPADAAEVTFSGAVELLAVLRRHRDSEVRGLPDASSLAATIRDLWKKALALLGVNSRLESAGSPELPIDFHLHNWATFLGRQQDRRDMEEACRLFDAIVIPARTAYYRRSGDFRPLLHSLQNAAAANTVLADQDLLAGDRESANQRLRQGRDWMRDAIEAPYTQQLLEDAAYEASDEACRFALLAVPALLGALENGVTPDPSLDRKLVADLIDVAARFADSIGKRGGHYARSQEVISAATRLDLVGE